MNIRSISFDDDVITIAYLDVGEARDAVFLTHTAFIHRLRGDWTDEIDDLDDAAENLLSAALDYARTASPLDEEQTSESD